jgi:hypothetical protein
MDSEHLKKVWAALARRPPNYRRSSPSTHIWCVNYNIGRVADDFIKNLGDSNRSIVESPSQGRLYNYIGGAEPQIAYHKK